MDVPVAAPDPTEVEALVFRLFEAAVGTFDLLTIYLGDQLGLYDHLAERPMTARELAERAGCDTRYVREWLEQQAVSALIAVEDPSALPDERHYRLPDAAVEVLTNRDSLAYLAPFGQLTVGSTMPIEAVVAAFRTGGGVPFTAYGAHIREGIAVANRPTFINQMASEWLPAMPDVETRLRADPPARVADIGCGSGWSSIAMAQGFPKVQVDGIDVDAASITDARRNAEEAGVADRVNFHHHDASAPGPTGPYDLVMAYECVHDMSDPVGALRAMRLMAGAGGAVLVADENTPDTFEAPGDILSRFQYGISVLHCLPVGRAESPSAETGTVMRQDTFRRYAAEAGYSAVDILPIEHDFWRFYRLTP
jgi:methylase of polypeptide subunit release factors